MSADDAIGPLLVAYGGMSCVTMVMPRSTDRAVHMVTLRATTMIPRALASVSAVSVSALARAGSTNCIRCIWSRGHTRDHSFAGKVSGVVGERMLQSGAAHI